MQPLHRMFKREARTKKQPYKTTTFQLGNKTTLTLKMQNKFFEDEDEHWETWLGKVYVYHPPKKQRGRNANLVVPINIVDHLGLSHKDRISVAIRHVPLPKPKEPSKPQWLNEEGNKNGAITKVEIISICVYKSRCYYKSFRNSLGHGKRRHSIKNSLWVCKFYGTCNQKKTLTTNEASKKYGIPKNG